jgi:hypothetical protein
MELLLGHDFNKVKIHTDDQAAESVRAFNTRAYATGNHIAFGFRQYSPTTSEGKELLFHELIHVAQSQGNNKLINFWSKDEHHKLTKEMVDFYRLNQYSPSIMRDPLFGGEQFYRIIDSSFDMDVTAKRILRTGPRFLIKKVPIISPLGTKGEGPEHGEDDNYSKPGKKIGEVNNDARNKNVALQEKYVKQSLDFYKKEKGQIRRYVDKKIQVTSNVIAMFKALGDACHVAQDRGAHWEGTKGMGHDDKRAREGAWNPDSPTDNREGYSNARKNTREVFKKWTWEITMSIGYDWG